MQKAATIVAQSGIAEDGQHGAVVPPIYLSTTYAFPEYDRMGAYDYSRRSNPTRDQFARALAELEGGADAVVTASGMAAVNLVVQLLEKDDLLVIPHDCYGGSYRLFNHLAAKGHFQLAVIDQTNPLALAGALARKPAMLWVETPSNPLLRLVDIRALCDQAKEIGCRVVVDNTFLSPTMQQPLALGADLVLHSTTKYINGHSDVVGGAVIAKETPLAEELAWLANCLGLTGSAFDSYLQLRGLRTLPLRMRQAEHSARRLALYLEQHPAVKQVHYPGLASHPQHALAQRQQQGFGAMLSFELAGDEHQVQTFLTALELFTLAESLGGVESLIAHPATMTHAAMDETALATAGISRQLLRLSIGIEDSDDLLNALDRALEAVRQQQTNTAIQGD